MKKPFFAALIVACWAAGPSAARAADVALAHVPYLGYALGYRGPDPEVGASATDVPNTPMVLENIRASATQLDVPPALLEKRAASGLLLGMLVRHDELQKSRAELDGLLGPAAAADIEQHASNISRNGKHFRGLLSDMRSQTGGGDFNVLDAAARLRRIFDGERVKGDEAPIWTGTPPSKRSLAKARAARGTASARVDGKNRAAVSPDGRWVALVQGDTLFVFDRASGSPIETARLPIGNVTLLAFDPASSRLAIHGRDEVIVAGLRPTFKRQAQWKTPQSYADPLSMAFSPDGSEIALAIETDHDSDTRGGSGGRYDIYFLDAATGAENHHEAELGFRVTKLAFEPSGNVLVINGRIRVLLR